MRLNDPSKAVRAMSLLSAWSSAIGKHPADSLLLPLAADVLVMSFSNAF